VILYGEWRRGTGQGKRPIVPPSHLNFNVEKICFQNTKFGS